MNKSNIDWNNIDFFKIDTYNYFNETPDENAILTKKEIKKDDNALLKYLMPEKKEKKINVKNENLKHAVEDYLLQYYGEACSEYSDECMNCQKWRAYQILFCDSIEKIKNISQNNQVEVDYLYYKNKKWPNGTEEKLKPSNDHSYWCTKILPSGLRIGPYKLNNFGSNTPFEVLCILEEQGLKYQKTLNKFRATLDSFPEI